MSDLTRREFLRQSMLLAAGMALVSCDDKYDEINHDSPGTLSGTQPSKKVICLLYTSDAADE